MILFQCLIGDSDTIVLCILKNPDMVQQIKRALADNPMTKITIENFQKRDGVIFTSEKSSIEIDTEVIILSIWYTYTINIK